MTFSSSISKTSSWLGTVRFGYFIPKKFILKKLNTNEKNSQNADF